MVTWLDTLYTDRGDYRNPRVWRYCDECGYTREWPPTTDHTYCTRCGDTLTEIPSPKLTYWEIPGKILSAALVLQRHLYGIVLDTAPSTACVGSLQSTSHAHHRVPLQGGSANRRCNTRSPAGKPIDRVSHHTQQTYYSRVRRYNVWKPLLQPIIATEIDARKITISGE